MAKMLCVRCQAEGKPRRATRGTLAVEIALWLFFLLPGFVYTCWRMSTRYDACRECGASDLVPLDSPRARALRGVAMSMLAVLALAACGGSEGDDPGKDPTDETKQCVLPEGLECHAWWPDWPDKTREGTLCTPPEVNWSYQCWWIERQPTCESGKRSIVFAYQGVSDEDRYEVDCVDAKERWECINGGGERDATRDPRTYTPPECLAPWDA